LSKLTGTADVEELINKELEELNIVSSNPLIRVGLTISFYEKTKEGSIKVEIVLGQTCVRLYYCYFMSLW